MTFATANKSTGRDMLQKPLLKVSVPVTSLLVPGLHAGIVSVSGHRRVGGSGHES